MKTTRLRDGVPIYLVENDNYFGTEEIYTRDELKRFLFFSLTIPAIISKLGLHPDIIHCHYWHTALTPLWLAESKMNIPCIFTIHNLAYQGSFDQQFFSDSGLCSVWQDHIPHSAPMPPLSFMGQGILTADVVTTVSSTYASEILTPQYGVGLEQLLNYRRNELYGILNGIDYREDDPATDSYLERYWLRQRCRCCHQRQQQTHVTFLGLTSFGSRRIQSGPNYSIPIAEPTILAGWPPP